MLATRPQSIKNILSNSINTYKNVFRLVLPIAVIWSIMYLVEFRLNKIDEIWANLGSFPSALLVLLCFCWGVIFIHNILTRQTIGYKTSLRLALKRFLRVFATVIIVALGLALIVVTLAGVLAMIRTYLLNLPKMDAVLMPKTLLILLLFPGLIGLFSLTGISVLEILIKNSGIFHGIKRAVKIFFHLENLWRILCFLIIIVVLAILIFIPTLAVAALLIKYSYTFSDLMPTIAIAFLIFLTLTLIWFPLFLSILIHLYNDLVLRFEKL